ncbi:MAG: hypothetical protein KIT57_04850 [Blastocatellales bacterium]|nr:hypothetical protein [Blastocatellales bacterium]
MRAAINTTGTGGGRGGLSGPETWQIYGMGGELLAEYAAGGAVNAPQKEYGYRGGQLLIVAESGVT